MITAVAALPTTQPHYPGRRALKKAAEPAHFHGEHGGQQAKFDFEGELIAGEISSRQAF